MDDDRDEWFASGRTIDYANSTAVTTGSVLYSNRSRPMATVVEDTCGHHDILLTPCSQQTFDLLYPEFEGAYHPSLLREPRDEHGGLRRRSRPHLDDAQHLHERVERARRRACTSTPRRPGRATASCCGPRPTSSSASPPARPRSPTTASASRSTTASTTETAARNACSGKARAGTTWHTDPVDLDVVRRAPLFKALDDEAASALQSEMSRSHMERGDVLFHEGDRGDTLYVIAEGKIKARPHEPRRPREPRRDPRPRRDVRRASASSTRARAP